MCTNQQVVRLLVPGPPVPPVAGALAGPPAAVELGEGKVRHAAPPAGVGNEGEIDFSLKKDGRWCGEVTFWPLGLVLL